MTNEHEPKDAVCRPGGGMAWPEPKFVPAGVGVMLNPERVRAAFEEIRSELTLGEQLRLAAMIARDVSGLLSEDDDPDREEG